MGNNIGKKISESLKKFHKDNLNSPAYKAKQEKNRIKATGRKHTEETKIKLQGNNNALGAKRSKQTRKKISDTLSKKKGWVTNVNRLIRASETYKQWRSDVFSRDNWTCQTCGQRGYEIEVHHKKEFSKIIQEFKIKNHLQALDCLELWDLNNGVTLCKKCHKRVHKRQVI